MSAFPSSGAIQRAIATATAMTTVKYSTNTAIVSLRGSRRIGSPVTSAAGSLSIGSLRERLWQGPDVVRDRDDQAGQDLYVALHAASWIAGSERCLRLSPAHPGFVPGVPVPRAGSRLPLGSGDLVLP